MHTVRARLLCQLPAALGGAAAPVPAAVPAPGARRAVPGTASAQPHPQTAHPVRLPRPRLWPLGPAPGARGACRALRLRPCPLPPPRLRLPARRPRPQGRARAGGRRRNAARGRPGRGRAPGAAGRLLRARAGTRASSPRLEAAREGAAGAALGAAGRGAAHGPQVPGEVHPVHGSRPKLRQGPGRRPRPGKRGGMRHPGTERLGWKERSFWNLTILVQGDTLPYRAVGSIRPPAPILYCYLSY